ncbi:hypothetical protein [Rhizobium rhizogenes]|uniref:Uncharacterized protein n=1 Tax=Rhizobium rhizogenes NBRC 13257 TaxID=1220581 RepID=A0AA87Q148_RHIRH|nr:hypothetical protein [Rhizobium rhizogenes]NTF57861.1 hypothetical protein [Rhizobium rhizogenes]NTF77443.1 hypothetical protein [Rhizobium rhizogenes]NTI37008.1 hypothetical protein [Rhizobium rhizogenes]GAJ93601.1 hypothetical protein RRH01S_06_02220 [Rhizobium rhizogenes NBRC 13257]
MANSLALPQSEREGWKQQLGTRRGKDGTRRLRTQNLGRGFDLARVDKDKVEQLGQYPR